ncbi:MAG: hypothetical protein M4D85_12940 [Actinomycetota bacterium]|nr:hypothetical protein [Actinomycetota bacterium]
MLVDGVDAPQQLCAVQVDYAVAYGPGQQREQLDVGRTARVARVALVLSRR